MLKIKDNVDLKELEKYGFEKTEYLFGHKIYQTHIRLYEDNTNKPCMRVRSDRRIVETYDNISLDNPDVDLLCDLIKDGLVEKVDE